MEKDAVIAELKELAPMGTQIGVVGMDVGWYIVYKLGVDLYGYEGALEVLDL